MSRIADIIDPTKIDYIISNHSEMDHTGALPDVIKLVKPEKVFASPKGVDALNAHFELEMPLTPVKDGETLDLGNMTIEFIDTKMIHWPDSMFSYLNADRGLLFSNDAFGMHLASAERFDDEIDDWIIHYETARYYANILWPTSALVEKLLAKMSSFNKPLKMILPDHGPVWRKGVSVVLDWYNKLSSGYMLSLIHI